MEFSGKTDKLIFVHLDHIPHLALLNKDTYNYDLYS